MPRRIVGHEKTVIARGRLAWLNSDSGRSSTGCLAGRDLEPVSYIPLKGERFKATGSVLTKWLWRADFNHDLFKPLYTNRYQPLPTIVNHTNNTNRYQPLPTNSPSLSVTKHPWSIINHCPYCVYRINQRTPLISPQRLCKDTMCLYMPRIYKIFLCLMFMLIGSQLCLHEATLQFWT